MFKLHITNSYGKEAYKLTTKLQELKKRSAVSKNQWIFLEKCIHHNVIPRSFRTRPVIDSSKGRGITNAYNKHMVLIAKNEVKTKYHRLLSSISSTSTTIKNIVSDEDHQRIVEMTEKSREHHFCKQRDKLRDKFCLLKCKSTSIKAISSTSLIKPSTINLTEKAIPKNHTDLLNLGPRFVPVPTSVPIMDIVASTEMAAVNLDNAIKSEEAEGLRHDVSRLLSKYTKKKIPSNLNKEQRQALKELKEDSAAKIYNFDKGAGFVIMEKEEALQKIKEQIGDAKVCQKDPTSCLVRKFQGEISRLKKEEKIDKQLFYSMYPSDAIPPRMYGMIKAHKPEKGYPMRTVVSTIGTASYGTSKYLVDLIQPTLNKNVTRLNNSTSFVEEAKKWEISSDEYQVSFDVVALYPSVPISKAIEVICDLLKDDWQNVERRTKLNIDDIRSLVVLSLSKCYFMFDNKLYMIEDAGPIGLSLMVVIAEGYLQYIEKKAITVAIEKGVAPVTFTRYVDDSHARFKGSIEKAEEFKMILNAQDPKIQYTIEREEGGKLNFLDVTCINNGNSHYEFEVFRKDAITNIQLKPHSSVNPEIFAGVFKGFIARAIRICSPNHLQNELDFLTDIFAENGHNRSHLNEIIEGYMITKQRVTRNSPEKLPTMVRIPWIPRIGPRLRKIFRRYGVKIAFSSTSNLSDILCDHKCKLPPHSQPGVYKVKCTCGSTYIGETKKRVATRLTEHQKDLSHKRWKASGLAEHAETCSAGIKWSEAETLCVEPDYRKRKIREALEIQRFQCGPRYDSGMNRDEGNIVKSTSWKALFGVMNK